MNLRIKVADIPLISYGICVFLFILGQSKITDISNVLSFSIKIMRVLFGILPFLMMRAEKRINLKSVFLTVFVSVIIGWNILFNEAGIDLIYIVVFMSVCNRSNVKRIIRTYCISAFGALAVVIFAWIVGILETEYVAGRNYMGFRYTTFGPNIFFHALLAYIVIKDKIKVSTWGVILAINIVFFQLTKTRAVYYLIYGVVFVYWFARTQKVQKILWKNAVLKFILRSFPFVTCIFTFMFQRIYANNYKQSFWVTLNKVMSNRLYFGKVALEKYKISWLGQPIEWITRTDGSMVSPESYFYVDSSYLQIILRYGIIMLLVMCVIMSIVVSYGIIREDINFVIAVSMFLIHCITDPQLLSFRHNPFLITAIASLNFYLMYRRKGIKKGGDLRE